MGNEVEKFDPATLMQGVKDRIKATFISLIPDDEWDRMVNSEIDKFFEPTKMKISSAGRQSSGYGYGNTRDKFESDTIIELEMSPFQQIIWDMCAEKAREKLKAKLETEYFENQWELKEETINEKLKQVMVEATPLVMHKMFEKMTLSAASIAREMLRN